MDASDPSPQADGAALGFGESFVPRLFKALADPSRLSILAQLADCCPRTVSQIAECCPLDLSVVSRHLALLRDAGVLAAEKRGKEVFYHLEAKDLADTLRSLADALERPGSSPKEQDP